ncbi:phosphotransferase [uncultured Roseovarius sp.]|uniref:phosphotransferase n=1 Tax=uncultured Roseovarius sp. TaxID=293344 RepID=UPI002601E6DD|nr:phosphotransferase [uncultured Roseovarius sp.]
MSEHRPHAPLPDLDRLQRLSARLAQSAAAHPVLERLDIDEVLRIVPEKRAILAGTFDGRAAVIRMVEPDFTEKLAREWAELVRIWPHMNDGAYRVAQPLLHVPEAGLMVTERIEGKPLLEFLWQEQPDERPQHLRPAAEWLRLFTEMTESWRAGNALGWLARAERAASKQPFARLRRIETGILEHLRKMAAQLDGAECRDAISHGDFHPNNLVIGKDHLTGIDTGGSGRLPVCKDIARFLVHMGRRGMILSGQRRLGVDAAGIEIFTDVFGLSETERRLWLPFFIGIEALIRVETRALGSGRIRHAEDMYGRLLEDLGG